MSEEYKQKLKEYCETKNLNKKTWLFFFSLYKKWNKKLCISEKMASLKVLFIKIKTH